MDHSREWHNQDSKRLKWYLGHVGDSGGTLQSGRTLFHPKQVGPPRKGSCIPKAVRACRRIGDADEAATKYCERLAHLPLGKNKDNKASSYAEGTQIVRRNVSLKESSQLSFVRREANVHPIDIWDVSSLKGKHYEGLKFRRNLEQIDGKHIGTKTFASVGINTALLPPNVVGKFIIDVANVNDVVKCDPIDGRLSCQQRERQRYGQQQQLRDTKHGTPVAREYKGASQLHLGLTEKLNFAPANVSQMSSVKDLEIEMLIQVADNWTKKEAETREKVSEEENKSRLTEVFTPLEVSDTHAATPHELTLGRKETGAESDSASETAMEGQMNAQVEMTNRLHEIETTPLDEVHDKRMEQEIGMPWVMKVLCTPMPSELKNKVKDQSIEDHKYVIGSRLQTLYTEDRQEAMYNVLRQGFKEVLEILQRVYPGDLRAQGVYDMRFGQNGIRIIISNLCIWMRVNSSSLKDRAFIHEDSLVCFDLEVVHGSSTY